MPGQVSKRPPSPGPESPHDTPAPALSSRACLLRSLARFRQFPSGHAPVGRSPSRLQASAAACHHARCSRRAT
eukprot:7564575-Heterocapsa_arctica.AAC.1